MYQRNVYYTSNIRIVTHEMISEIVNVYEWRHWIFPYSNSTIIVLP